MEHQTKIWLEHSHYDLETAKSLFIMRKYLYVAFMCQQATEKGLKACLASQNKIIPRIHNLRKLANLCGLDDPIDTDQIDFLEELTPFAIKARYGEYKRKLSELCTRSKAEKILRETQGFIRWIKKQIK